MIQIYHLTKSYPSGPLVFQDAYFSAPEGSLVVLYGGNRSGKTTLLKLLCGEETPTSGLVLVSGRRVLESSEGERREFLKDKALVFPDLGLLGDHTVLDNLRIPLQLKGRYQPEDQRRILQLLERVGMAGRENQRPSDLSFGEQRAVVLLRAIVQEPVLLLADEPFQGLDDPLIGMFLDLLFELQQRTSTSILSTQDPAPIARAVRKRKDFRVIWANLSDRRILPSEAPPC